MGCGFGKKERKWERNEVLEDYKRRERERNSTTHSHIKRASGSFSLHQKASLYH
jgi:hypothetical protein